MINKMARSCKWWILEDALTGNHGHYYEYVRTFKIGLEAEDDSVRIFVDRGAEDWLVESLAVEREMPKSIWALMSDGAPRWKRLLRYPGHGLQTFWAVRRLLRTHRNDLPDIAFFPSVLTHHLIGLVPLLRTVPPRVPTRFLLFFPSVPIRHDPSTGRAVSKADFTAKWFPLLIRGLRPLVEAGRVILGTETHAMQNALTELCGLPFTYLPHPVDCSAESSARQQDAPLVIGHYGSARYEKGSDLFQAAAKIWLEQNPDANVRFVMQWLEDFHDESGNLIQKDVELLKHPKFRFIDRYFDPDGGYLRQVAETDLMVLPYRDSYRYRLSRVVIEAILAGLPVIVSRGTTLHEQAADFGASVDIEMDSEESLIEGLNQAIRRCTEMNILATGKSKNSAKHFSVANFRESLLKP